MVAETLLKLGKIDEVDKEVQLTYDRLVQMYGGKLNADVIEYIFVYACRLNEAGYHNKSLEQLKNALNMQKEYRGEASDKYREITTTIKKVEATKEKYEGNI
eukprot:CAMPEP_0205814134 /NCGR_PEP_ID=MMETSP0205-20121125/19108_1 /ASSEMBLY_ACC=CAM_ASM_000278 /TAXON_ID=36767 /ORGANISM="Euplotes focardii, Strain TN1" /LENGTH=101 /DNA_ID=CAMNT_0053097549 /DNA_START=225 /DNA_END=527 /DNA_ORIENTATION=-